MSNVSSNETKKRVHKRVQIVVNDGILEQINEICKEISCNTSELIRNLIREKHYQTFPPYASKKVRPFKVKVPQLTLEQECEERGGTIYKHDGALFYKIPKFSEVDGSPLVGNFESYDEKDFIKYLKNNKNG